MTTCDLRRCAPISLCVAAAVVCISTCLTPMQAQTAATPTLSDTTAWLNQNLVGIGIKFVSKQVSLNKKGEPDEKHAIRTYEEMTVSAARFNGCQAELTTQRNVRFQNGNTGLTESVYRIPLSMVKISPVDSKINLDNYKSEKYLVTTDPISFFRLRITADRDVMSASTNTRGSNGTSSSNSEMTGYVTIESDDADMLQRIEKALAHATDLCRSAQKPDVF